MNWISGQAARGWKQRGAGAGTRYARSRDISLAGLHSQRISRCVPRGQILLTRQTLSRARIFDMIRRRAAAYRVGPGREPGGSSAPTRNATEGATRQRALPSISSVRSGRLDLCSPGGRPAIFRSAVRHRASPRRCWSGVPTLRLRTATGGDQRQIGIAKAPCCRPFRSPACWEREQALSTCSPAGSQIWSVASGSPCHTGLGSARARAMQPKPVPGSRRSVPEGGRTAFREAADSLTTSRSHAAEEDLWSRAQAARNALRWRRRVTSRLFRLLEVLDAQRTPMMRNSRSCASGRTGCRRAWIS